MLMAPSLSDTGNMDPVWGGFDFEKFETKSCILSVIWAKNKTSNVH